MLRALSLTVLLLSAQSANHHGTVALIEATTTGCTESGRFVIPKSATTRKPSGRIWTPPVISGGRLFLRDQELIFCFNLKVNN